ncbi:MAG: hypothetical protein K5739_07705 [Lachnospiraceae bacterium]|nr:hypothetical protein [Lachnospiraceae bacterium]
MNEKINKKADPAWAVLFLVLVLLTVIGGLKTLFLSADIDESYAVTMAVRLCKGDRLFLEMWEPHQLSAVLYAPAAALWLLVCGPYSKGIVLFLRCFGFGIQALLSLWIYLTLAGKKKDKGALLAAFLYLNFTPKHIQSPEFTTALYWSVTALLLCFYAMIREGRGQSGGEGPKKSARLLPVFAGLCISAMVLCYPACILVFFYAFLVLLRLDQAEGKNRKRAAAFFITAGVMALCLLLYMALRGDFAKALSDVSFVLSDGSHKQSLLWLWKGHLQAMFSAGCISGGLLVLTFVAEPVLKKKKKDLSFLWPLFLALQGVYMLWQFHSVDKKVYYDYLPIVFQLALIGGFFLFFRQRREEEADGGARKEWLAIAYMISALATAGVLSMSNLPGVYSFGFLLIPVVLTIPYGIEEMSRCSKWEKAACLFFLFVMTAQIFAVRIALVRFSGNQHRTVFEDYYKVNQGPLAGIRLGADDWKHHDDLLHVFGEQMEPEDILLYVGPDYFIYSLLPPGKIGTGNTISTPLFSQQLLAYYERFPERVPTILVFETDYIDDYRKVLSYEPFEEFVNRYFDTEHVEYVGTQIVMKRKK